jgi:hypothetical protein
MATDFLGRFDSQVARVFKYAARAAWKNPKQALFFARIQAAQARSARRRDRQRGHGVQVPPLVIASITRRCNLNCRGCYARARRHSPRPELTDEQWSDLFAQAQDLGFPSSCWPAVSRKAMGLAPGANDVRDLAPGVYFCRMTTGSASCSPASGGTRHASNVTKVVLTE